MQPPAIAVTGDFTATAATANNKAVADAVLTAGAAGVDIDMTNAGGTFGATINGEASGNVLKGSAKADILDGKAGADTLTGNGGADAFNQAENESVVWTAEGIADAENVLAANDTLTFGNGLDVITDWTDGSDTITGLDAGTLNMLAAAADLEAGNATEENLVAAPTSQARCVHNQDHLG